MNNKEAKFWNDTFVVIPESAFGNSPIKAYEWKALCASPPANISDKPLFNEMFNCAVQTESEVRRS